MGNGDQEQAALLIDANVILEFLLARPRQDECLALLQHTTDGNLIAFVMSYAVHSIEYMLYREGNLTALRIFLELLQSSVGLTMYESSPAEDLAALAFTKKAEAPFQLDFDDALHYATAKKHNLALVTFDHDFDRTDLTRATPADVLSRYG